MTAPRIPATIVTGFLGAGKTSLLQNLAKSAGGRRLAFVINEFGETGIDRDLLLGCGIAGCDEDDIIELANGCICCTVADDFLPTIEKLLDRREPPDHIVIETSGLALPKPLVKAFAWPEVRSRVTVDGVIVVVDAPAAADGRFADDPEKVVVQFLADTAVAHENPLGEVFEDQLACADLVLLNKADLLDAHDLGVLSRRLRTKLRPGVRLVPSRFGAVDAGVLLGLGAAAEADLGNRSSHNEAEGDDHDHDDFESFVVTLPKIPEINALLARIVAATAAHDVLRVKGFADVPGKSMRLAIQGVGPRLDAYFDRPWRVGEARAGRLVVIGFKGLPRDAIGAIIRG